MTSNIGATCFSSLSGKIQPPQISGIREISFHEVGASVTYASMPWNNPMGGAEERNKAKLSLMSALVKRRLDEGQFFWVDKGDCLSSSLLEISYSRLRKPRLLLNGLGEPLAVSFSHMNGRTWAAIRYDVRGVGIDAACADEFRGAYPFARAFHREELELAAGLGCRDRAETAAFVWAAKEAAVKAFGCGFHLLDPLDVRIVQTYSNKHPNEIRMLALPERKSETIVVKYKPAPVTVVRECGCFVAIAVVNQDHLS